VEIMRAALCWFVSFAAFLSLAALPTAAHAALLTTITYPTVVQTIPSPTIQVGFAARDGSGPYVVWQEFTAVGPNTPLVAPPATLAALAAELTMTTPGNGFFSTSINLGSQSFANVHLFATGPVPGTDPQKSGAIVAANVPQLGPGMQGYALDQITMEYTDWTPNGSNFRGSLVVKIYGVVVPEPGGAMLVGVGLAVVGVGIVSRSSHVAQL
jgi:hypothetical protein